MLRQDLRVKKLLGPELRSIVRFSKIFSEIRYQSKRDDKKPNISKSFTALRKTLFLFCATFVHMVLHVHENNEMI